MGRADGEHEGGVAQPEGLIRDRYETIDVLGRGGQGEVYKALDHQHGRVVALKLRPVPDGDQRHALLAEARILLSLRPHPSLPLVREDFFWEDRYALVMDWVEGTDLGALLLDTGDPGLPVSSVLSWLSQAADAIDHLHSQGVIHGDVKPANVVLTPEGRVVLVDFGISRRPDESGLRPLGSPGYAAPELLTGEVSGAADVYGLAATAVALLTGSPPTGGRPDWEGVPNAAAIERAIRRGLAIDPARRPRSATELVERLRAHLSLDLPTGVVTFLLTDIEGSTAQWEDDPDSMSELIATHDGLVADAVESNGGRLLKTRGEGDSTFSVFTRASDAAAAALAVQRTLIAQTGLSVRVAIHSGEAETRDGDYFGRTVNRASRLRSVARGGQVLLSSAAADLVVDALPDGATLVDLGFRELRDLARGEQVFALSHPSLPPVEVPADPPAMRPPFDPFGATPQPASRSTRIEPAARDISDFPSRLDDEAPAEPGVVDAPTRPPAEGQRPPVTSAPSAATSSALHLPLPPALTTARTATFVGRDAELARLLDAWHRTRTGERRLMLLAGEPGIGKTQLAIELAAAAHAEGATVLHGRCDDGLQVPYQPFAAALAQVLDDSQALGGAPALGRLAGELVRLAPDVAALVPGLPPPLRADPETEQYRLFDAVSLWLQAMAEAGPVVLVLDDLHWATRPTLHLLRHVLRTSEPTPLFVVGTYRDTELSRGHPLSELLGDLHRLPGMDRLVVDGLDEDEVVALLNSGAGHDLGGEGRQLAHAIHGLTDGNPFFVRELLRHMVETGTLAPGADGRWTVAPTTEPLGVPEGVREVVGRRLGRLSEAASATLELAAVIGVDFDLDVLVAAGSLDEEDVLSALDEAVAARLVLESGPLRFRFAHTIVRATISDGLTRARRSRAHRRVAEAIEHRYAGDVDAHLTELAMHYAEAATAGDGTKAVEYATRAGDLASARLAHEEAVDCYRLACELLVTTAAPVDEQSRCRLLIALGEAERLAGDPAARSTLLEAARVALRWRDASLLARAALANSQTSYGPADDGDPERVRVLEAAVDLVDDEDSATRARLLAHLGLERSSGAAADEGLQHANRALAIARRLDDPAVLAEVLVLRSGTLIDPSAGKERLALADQQLALAAQLGDPALEVQAAINGTAAAVEGGDIELARVRLDRARVLADGIGQLTFRWQVRIQDARLALIGGRFEEADHLINEALAAGRAAGHDEALLVYISQLYTARWLQGRLDEISGVVRQWVDSRPEQPLGRIAVAQTLVQQGRLDEARRWFEPVVDATEPPFPGGIPRNATWLAAIIMAAEVCFELDDASRAQIIIDQLLPYRGVYVQDRVSWGGAVDAYIGRLYMTIRRWDDAEAALRDALVAHERVGSVSMSALSRVDLGDLLLRRNRLGERDEGRSLLTAGLVVLDRLGMRAQGDRARRLLDQPSDEPLGTVESPTSSVDLQETGPSPERDAPTYDRDAPFVGRRDELERLAQALEDARAGSSRVVQIAGEPGIGKTRLLDEFANIAAMGGARVLRGHSDDGSGGPFQPFVESLVEMLHTTDGEDSPRLLGRLGHELARLVPEVAPRLPGQPAPIRSDPETERYRLFDAVVGWLRASSSEQPLVLLLDDLQNAGRPTLQLLRHVARSLLSARVLVVIAYRDTELGRGSPLTEVLFDLNREPGAERLSLGGLLTIDVAALAARLFALPIGSDAGLPDLPAASLRPLARTLHDESGGNPFFVRELVAHLRHAAAGRSDDLDVQLLGAAPLSSLGVPEGVRALVRRRLERLEPATVDVLRTASLIGESFDLALVGEVVDLDEDALFNALDEASAAGIVREQPGLRARYRFNQALVRAALSDELEPTARSAIHERVGQAIERTYPEQIDDHLSDLAHHFALAGTDPRRTIDYLMRSGDRALEQLADDVAASSYQQALDVLQASPEVGDVDRRRAAALVRLGETQRRSADPAYRETLLEAAELARRTGATDLLVQAALANYRSTFSAVGQVDEERIAVLEEALAAVGEDDSAPRATLLARLAVELMFSGDFERRLALSSEALGIARRLDDPDTLAHVIACRIEAIGHASTIDERRRLLAEQAELASRLGDPDLAMLNSLQRYYALLSDGQGEEASLVLQRALDDASGSSQPMLRWIASACRATRAFIAGQFDETEALLSNALELGQQANQPDVWIVYVGQLGLVRFFQGRLSEFEAMIDAAAAAAPSLPTLQAALATLLVEIGRHDDARALFDELAGDEFAAFEPDLVWLSGIALCAQVCYRLEDTERAAVLVELLRPYAGKCIAEGPNFLGSVHRYMALLATLLGQFEDADRWHGAALTTHERLGADGFATLSRVDWAAMLARRGDHADRDRARALLDRAITDAERLGMTAALAEAHALLEALARPPLPAGLGPRGGVRGGGAPVGRVFVGRDEELARLRELWHKADSGTRQLVLVAGEPGIGKTSLAAELALGAYDEGALVLFGRCDEDAVVPLQPFVEVLRELLAVGALHAADLGSDLVRLLPEIDASGSAPPASDDPGAERYRLFDALSTVLDTIAGSRTIVLVLDDLHWADQPTLLAARHLIRRRSSVGMIVIGTYRDTEVSRVHPLADVLAELRRERLFERLVLRGLSNDEVVALVERRAGYPLDDEDQDFAVSLREVAEGNPFFIGEILRHLAETGALVRGDDGRWDTAARSWDELEIPEGVRDLIGRRLSRLSSTGEQLLAAGAVLGRSFSYDVVRRMVDASAEDVLAALDEALTLHLLNEAATGALPGYAFSHALVRETLYDELSLPRRQRLHVRAAEAIEAAYPPEQLEAFVGALAVHHRQAGAAADPAGAVEWSVRAAEAAFRVFAYQEAAGHFEGAIAILGELGGRDNDLRRARLLERLLKLRFFSGSDPEEGVRLGEEALAIYERYGEQRRAATIQSQLGAHLATAGTARGLDVARGLRHLEAAAPVLGGGDDRAAGYFHVSMANATVRALRLDDVEHASTRAIEIAGGIGDRSLWANASLLRGLGLFEKGQLEEGGALIEQAHAVADELNNPALVLLTTWNRGYQLLGLDDPVAAEAWFARELAGPRFTDAPRAASALRLNHHRCLFELGRLADLEAGWTGGWAAAIADRLGDDVDHARDQLIELLSAQRDMGDIWTLLWHTPMVAGALRRLGDEDRARDVVDEGIVLSEASGAIPQQVALRCEQALLDPQRGQAAVDAAVALVEARPGWRAVPARIDHANGAVRAAQGDRAGAEAAFGRAVAGYRAANRPWAEAAALSDWARTVGAAERRTEAAAIYAQIGAAAHWSDRLWEG
jgi:predicted ATPase/class 3 adenylate cyclase